MTKKFLGLSIVAASLVVAGVAAVGTVEAAGEVTTPSSNPVVVGTDTTTDGTWNWNSTSLDLVIKTDADGTQRTLTYGGSNSGSNHLGGVIWACDVAELTVENLNITGGSVTSADAVNTYGGGGIHVGGVNQFPVVTLKNLDVYSNATAGTGGASVAGAGVHLHGLTKATLEDVIIKNNTLSSTATRTIYGGGLFVNDSSELIVTGGDISGNTAKQTGASGDVYGGGVAFLTPTAAYTTSVSMTDTTIKNNIAFSKNEEAFGGGMSISNRYNGAITADNKFTFDNMLFEGNQAISKASASAAYQRALGGAVFISDTSGKDYTYTFTDTNFKDNAAITVGTQARGGAIYTNRDITIAASTRDVVFSGNKTVTGATVNDDGTYTDGTEIANDIHFSAAKTVTFDAAEDMSITLDGGVTGGGSVVKTGAGDLIFAEGSINVVNDITVSGGTMSLAAGSVNDIGGVVTVKNEGTFVVDHGTIFDPTNLPYSAPGTFSLEKGTLRITNTDLLYGFFVSLADITLAEGTDNVIDVVGASEVLSWGNITGVIGASAAGNLTIMNSDDSGSGYVAALIVGGDTVNNAGKLVVGANTALVNYGEITVKNLSVGDASGTGVFTNYGTFTVSDNITVSGGTMSLAAGSMNAIGGLITVKDSGMFVVDYATGFDLEKLPKTFALNEGTLRITDTEQTELGGRPFLSLANITLTGTDNVIDVVTNGRDSTVLSEGNITGVDGVVAGNLTVMNSDIFGGGYVATLIVGAGTTNDVGDLVVGANTALVNGGKTTIQNLYFGAAPSPFARMSVMPMAAALDTIEVHNIGTLTVINNVVVGGVTNTTAKFTNSGIATFDSITVGDSSGDGIFTNSGILTIAGDLKVISDSTFTDSAGSVTNIAGDATFGTTVGATTTINGAFNVGGALTAGDIVFEKTSSAVIGGNAEVANMTIAAGDGQAAKVNIVGNVASSGTITVEKGATYEVKGTSTSAHIDIKNGGELKTGLAKHPVTGVWESNTTAHKADNTGTIAFGTGADWSVAAGHLGNNNPTATGVFIADGLAGATAAAKATNLKNINNALNAGDNYFYSFNAAELVAGGNVVLNATWNKHAKVSDAFVNTMMLHDGSAIREAGFGRVDYAQLLRSRDGSYRGQCGSGSGRVYSRDVWANYIGRTNELQSNFRIGQTSKFTSNGVQAGFDVYSNKYSVLGVMFGYEKHEGKLVNDRVNAEDFYFGVYGGRKFGYGWDVRGSFGLGAQDYKVLRASNTAGFYRSATNGNTAEGTIELGRRMYASSNLSLRPVFAFDFYTNTIAGAQETGANYDFALTYGNASLTQAFARFGSDLQWNRGRLNVNGGAYYSHMMSQFGNTLRTTVAGNGANYGLSNVAVGSNLGRNKLTFNAGGSYAFGERKALTAFGGYSGDYFTDRAGKPWGHNGHVGARYQF